jgi:MFS family permease
MDFPTTSKFTQKFTQDFRDMINSVTFNSFGFFFLDFLIPVVAIQLNASGTEMGILFSLRTFGYLISSSFVGFLTDKYSKRNLVILGSVGRGISYFLMYFAIAFESILGLSIGTAFLGFMAGYFWIPFNALIAEKSHKDNRSKAYGYRGSAQGRGSLIGAILGFTIFSISSGYGLSNFITYIALPVFGIANFYAGYIFLRKVNESEKIIYSENDFETNNQPNNQNDHSTSNLAIIIGLGLLLFAVLFASINYAIARPFLIPYLLETLSSDPTIAAMVWIPSGLISILLAPKLGEIADQINIYLGITIGSLCGALITYLLITSNDLLTFMILLTLDTTIATTTGLIFVNLVSRISQRHRGKVLGIRTIFEDLGALIGPIGGGILWDLFTRQTPFQISIIVEILLIPFFIISVYYLKPVLTEKYNKVRVIKKEKLTHFE